MCFYFILPSVQTITTPRKRKRKSVKKHDESNDGEPSYKKKRASKPDDGSDDGSGDGELFLVFVSFLFLFFQGQPHTKQHACVTREEQQNTEGGIDSYSKYKLINWKAYLSSDVFHVTLSSINHEAFMID